MDRDNMLYFKYMVWAIALSDMYVAGETAINISIMPENGKTKTVI